MGDRGNLHENKLEEFAEFLSTVVGFTRKQPRGDYEVLRMKLDGEPKVKSRWKPEGRMLLVHTRATGVHLSLHGNSSFWFQYWCNYRRRMAGRSSDD